MGVSTVKLNGTTLMTVNDTTATSAGVSNTEYFYAFPFLPGSGLTRFFRHCGKGHVSAVLPKRDLMTVTIHFLCQRCKCFHFDFSGKSAGTAF